MKNILKVIICILLFFLLGCGENNNDSSRPVTNYIANTYKIIIPPVPPDFNISK